MLRWRRAVGDKLVTNWFQTLSVFRLDLWRGDLSIFACVNYFCSLSLGYYYEWSTYPIDVPP